MLLITSSERLSVEGEWLYDMGGLEIPPTSTSDLLAEPVEGKGASTGSTLEHYSAPTLFLQTARRLRSDFQPDADNRAAILHICRLVDGMPLAIELAAS
ncbi:MAG TPA: hypothetical protein P5121_33720 [Caldilineaceae bacterium]|nr:hypothetical protein [Caldilineaceae bacterium]